MVEGARLESEYAAKPYRGFESLPLRQLEICRNPPMSRKLCWLGHCRAVPRRKDSGTWLALLMAAFDPFRSSAAMNVARNGVRRVGRGQCAKRTILGRAARAAARGGPACIRRFHGRPLASKVNEQVAIDRESTQKAFRKAVSSPWLVTGRAGIRRSPASSPPMAATAYRSTCSTHRVRSRRYFRNFLPQGCSSGWPKKETRPDSGRLNGGQKN